MKRAVLLLSMLAGCDKAPTTATGPGAAIEASAISAGMIADAGFLIPGAGAPPAFEGGWEDLSMGIAAIHKGVKPV